VAFGQKGVSAGHEHQVSVQGSVEADLADPPDLRRVPVIGAELLECRGPGVKLLRRGGDERHGPVVVDHPTHAFDLDRSPDDLRPRGGKRLSQLGPKLRCPR
jgi:hypothetical protein